MSEFLAPLDVRVLDETDGGRPVYQLLAPLRYQSGLLGSIVTVPAGFVTDFESVPRFAAGLAGPPCPKAGVVHDWLYVSHETDKTVADLIYREALLLMGLDPIYADQRYSAVDFYGRRAWADPGRERIRPC